MHLKLSYVENSNRVLSWYYMYQIMTVYIVSLNRNQLLHTASPHLNSIKKDDVAGHHRAKRSGNGKHRRKLWKSTMIKIICQKLFAYLCLNVILFGGEGGGRVEKCV